MREYEEGYPVDANDRYYQGDHPDPERENSSNFGFANVKRNAVPGGNKVREDATAYLNERLKVMPYESTEVLFDQRVEFHDHGISDPYYSWDTEGKLPVDYGDEVIVTFDGNTYLCTVFGQQGYYAIGNGALAGVSRGVSGVPFFVSWSSSENGIFTVFGCGPIAADMKIEREVAQTLDPKYLPNGGAGIGYERSKVIFDQEIAANDIDDMPQNIVLDVAAGDQLRVTWVDKEYVCEVVDMGEVIAFGNLSYAGDNLPDTGEPFTVAYLPGIGALFFAVDGPGVYYMKIVKEEIHTIDPKFLPGGGGGSGDMVVAIDVATMTPSRTYDEIVSALRSGRNARIQCILPTNEGTGNVYAMIAPCMGEGRDCVNFISFSHNNDQAASLLTFVLSKDNTITVREGTVLFADGINNA